MPGVTFNLVEEFSSLLEEIPSFREKLVEANPVAAQFRAANALYEAARQQFERPATPWPEDPSERRNAEERFKQELKSLRDENDAQWNAHQAAKAFIAVFLSKLVLVLQRLPPTPRWLRFADRVRQLLPGIAKLSSYREAMPTDDLRTLEIQLKYGLKLATAPANKPGSGVDGAHAKTNAELAKERQETIYPILAEKRWKRSRWATEAGVGKNCIYEYMRGERNPTEENRKAMAEALGLKPDELPE